MKQFILGCLVLAATNIFAQNAKVDSIVAQYTGKNISEYPGVAKADMVDPNKRNFRAGIYTYDTNKAHKVYSNFVGVAGTVTGTIKDKQAKLDYQKFKDLYFELINSLGEADKSEIKNGFTTYIYNGKHSTLTTQYNKVTGALNMIFVDQDLARL